MADQNCTKCQYLLTFSCGCQKPKCRVNMPDIATNGIKCSRFVLKVVNEH